ADQEEHEPGDDEPPPDDRVVDCGERADAGRRAPGILERIGRAARLARMGQLARGRDHSSDSRYLAMPSRTSSDRSWYSGMRLRGLTESLYAIHHATFSGVFTRVPAPSA